MVHIEGRGDLLVISFPKSGRTWLRVMLDEAGIAAGYTHLGWGHQSARRADDLAMGLVPGFKWTLGLFRDPRDTVVSGYYQVSVRLKNFDGSMSQFIRDPRHGLEKVIRFNLGLAGICAGRGDCMMASYEALHADPAAVLGSIAAFVGRPLDQAAARTIADNNTFDKMQGRERAGDYRERYGGALAVPADAATARLKVRRGVAGGYRDELGAADLDFCDRVLERTGYFGQMAGFLARP